MMTLHKWHCSGLLIAGVAYTLFAHSQPALGADWLCKESSSERTGNVLKACGVAQSKDEGLAREQANLRARQEFMALCDESEDCKGFKKKIRPLRTDCAKTEEGEFKCYRAIEFEISQEKLDEVQIQEEEIELLKKERESRERKIALMREAEEERRKIAELDHKIESREVEEEPPSGPNWFTRTFVSWNDGVDTRLALGISFITGSEGSSGAFATGLGGGVKFRAAERLDLDLNGGYTCGLSANDYTLSCVGNSTNYGLGMTVFVRNWWGLEPEIQVMTANSNTKISPGLSFVYTDRKSLSPQGTYVRLGVRGSFKTQLLLEAAWYFDL